MVGQGGLGWGSESLDLLSEELRAQYRSYRRRQARGLVRILPVEAVRPLYRMALNNVELDGSDPLEVLVQYCERILPLPPFEVWVADRSGYQAEHLRDMAEAAEVPTAESPATLEVRSFSYEGALWVANLRAFRDRLTWRGFIAFESEHSTEVHQTALVFSESEPADVQERFSGLEMSTLGAFLRSTLP